MKNNECFIKYIRFLYFLIFYFFPCIIFAQTDSTEIEISCSGCDSLYKCICPDNPVIFSGPEQLPQFPGGEEALMIFLRDNIQYPTECKEKRIQGRVIVKFIIDETGKIICPFIQRHLHPLMDIEALRIVKLMPDWRPASNNGIPSKMCSSLPITFKLDAKDLKKGRNPSSP